MKLDCLPSDSQKIQEENLEKKSSRDLLDRGSLEPSAKNKPKQTYTVFFVLRTVCQQRLTKLE